MSEPNLQAELEGLWRHLSSSVLLLYTSHSALFKALAVAVLGYLAFRMGRLTVTDPGDKDIEAVRQALRKRDHFTIYLPQKMKSLSRWRTAMILITGIATSAASAIYYLQPQLLGALGNEYLQHGLLALAVLIGATLLLCLYEKVIAAVAKRGAFNDQKIHERIEKVVLALGRKAEGILKGYLCRQKYLSRKNPPSGVCNKASCQQHRQLLHQRQNLYAQLVDKSHDFDWCSICKRRTPFDEFLEFQHRQFPDNTGAAEQKQVGERNKYLLCEIDRMAKWVQQVCPCNCSRRYWASSVRQIGDFKKQQKAIALKLQPLQSSSVK